MDLISKYLNQAQQAQAPQEDLIAKYMPQSIRATLETEQRRAELDKQKRQKAWQDLNKRQAAATLAGTLLPGLGPQAQALATGITGRGAEQDFQDYSRTNNSILFEPTMRALDQVAQGQQPTWEDSYSTAYNNLAAGPTVEENAANRLANGTMVSGEFNWLKRGLVNAAAAPLGVAGQYLANQVIPDLTPEQQAAITPTMAGVAFDVPNAVDLGGAAAGIAAERMVVRNLERMVARLSPELAMDAIRGAIDAGEVAPEAGRALMDQVAERTLRLPEQTPSPEGLAQPAGGRYAGQPEIPPVQPAQEDLIAKYSQPQVAQPPAQPITPESLIQEFANPEQQALQGVRQAFPEQPVPTIPSALDVAEQAKTGYRQAGQAEQFPGQPARLTPEDLIAQYSQQAQGQTAQEAIRQRFPEAPTGPRSPLEVAQDAQVQPRQMGSAEQLPGVPGAPLVAEGGPPLASGANRDRVQAELAGWKPERKSVAPDMELAGDILPGGSVSTAGLDASVAARIEKSLSARYRGGVQPETLREAYRGALRDKLSKEIGKLPPGGRRDELKRALDEVAYRHEVGDAEEAIARDNARLANAQHPERPMGAAEQFPGAPAPLPVSAQTAEQKDWGNRLFRPGRIPDSGIESTVFPGDIVDGEVLDSGLSGLEKMRALKDAGSDQASQVQALRVAALEKIDKEITQLKVLETQKSRRTGKRPPPSRALGNLKAQRAELERRMQADGMDMTALARKRLQAEQAGVERQMRKLAESPNPDPGQMKAEKMRLQKIRAQLRELGPPPRRSTEVIQSTPRRAPAQFQPVDGPVGEQMNRALTREQVQAGKQPLAQPAEATRPEVAQGLQGLNAPETQQVRREYYPFHAVAEKDGRVSLWDKESGSLVGVGVQTEANKKAAIQLYTPDGKQLGQPATDLQGFLGAAGDQLGLAPQKNHLPASDAIDYLKSLGHKNPEKALQLAKTNQAAVTAWLVSGEGKDQKFAPSMLRMLAQNQEMKPRQLAAKLTSEASTPGVKATNQVDQLYSIGPRRSGEEASPRTARVANKKPRGGPAEQVPTPVTKRSQRAFTALVDATKKLTGEVPELKALIDGSSEKLGAFTPGRKQKIELIRSLQKTPGDATMVLAHEVGHAVDFIPPSKWASSGIIGDVAKMKAAATGVRIRMKEFKALRNEAREVSRQMRPWIWGDVNELMDAMKVPNGERAQMSQFINKYRSSNEELYADFVGQMVLDPVATQAKAPKLTRAFMDELVARPEAQEAFERVMRLSGDGEEMGKFVQAQMEASKDNARQVRILKEMADRAKAPDVLDVVVGGFVRGQEPIFRQLRKNGWMSRVGAEDELVTRLSAAAYTNAELKSRLAPVAQAIEELGGPEDISNFLTFNRVTKGDRGQFFNVRGINRVTAEDGLKEMEKRLGAEKFQRVKKAADDFREAFVQSHRDAHAAGLLTDERLALAENSKDWYAPFKVADYLLDNPDFTLQVFENKGSLKDIDDPLGQMMLHMAYIQKAADVNGAKLALRDTYAQVYPEGFSPTKVLGNKTMTVFEAGKPVTYWVDPRVDNFIGQMKWHKNLLGLSKVLGFGKHVKQWWTGYNTAFQGREAVKNFNIVSRSLASLGVVDNKIAGLYIPGVSEAYGSVKSRAVVLNQLFRGGSIKRAFALSASHRQGLLGDLAKSMGVKIDEAGIQELMQNRAVMAPYTDMSHWSVDQGDIIHGNLARAGLRGSTRSAGNIAEKARYFMDTLESFTRVMDYTMKDAGYQIAAPVVGPERAAHYSRTYFGQPDPLERGYSDAAIFTNQMLNFFSTITSGQMAAGDLALAGGKVSRQYWFDKLAGTVIPLAVWMHYAHQKKDPEISEAWRRLPDHVKRNSVPILLGWFDPSKDYSWAGKGKKPPETAQPVVIRLPVDEQNTYLHSAIYDLMEYAYKKGEPGDLLESLVANAINTAAPYQENPVVDWYNTARAATKRDLKGRRINSLDTFGRAKMDDKMLQSEGQVLPTLAYAQFIIKQFGQGGQAIESWAFDPETNTTKHTTAKAAAAKRNLNRARTLTGMLYVGNGGVYQEEAAKKWQSKAKQNKQKVMENPGLLLRMLEKVGVIKDKPKLHAALHWRDNIFYPANERAEVLRKSGKTREADRIDREIALQAGVVLKELS